MPAKKAFCFSFKAVFNINVIIIVRMYCPILWSNNNHCHSFTFSKLNVPNNQVISPKTLYFKRRNGILKSENKFRFTSLFGFFDKVF